MKCPQVQARQSACSPFAFPTSCTNNQSLSWFIAREQSLKCKKLWKNWNLYRNKEKSISKKKIRHFVGKYWRFVYLPDKICAFIRRSSRKRKESRLIVSVGSLQTLGIDYKLASFNNRSRIKFINRKSPQKYAIFLKIFMKKKNLYKYLTEYIHWMIWKILERRIRYVLTF